MESRCLPSTLYKVGLFRLSRNEEFWAIHRDLTFGTESRSCVKTESGKILLLWCVKLLAWSKLMLSGGKPSITLSLQGYGGVAFSLPYKWKDLSTIPHSINFNNTSERNSIWHFPIEYWFLGNFWNIILNTNYIQAKKNQDWIYEDLGSNLLGIQNFSIRNLSILGHISGIILPLNIYFFLFPVVCTLAFRGKVDGEWQFKTQ